MANFYSEHGVAVLGSRLRQISERITQDNRRIFKAAKLDIEPRWYPILTTLTRNGPWTTGDLAGHIRLSHAATSQVIRQLKEAGYVASRPHPEDGRSNLVHLTAKGKTLARKFTRLTNDVTLAAQSIVAETGHDLMGALEALDEALSSASLAARVDALSAGKAVIVDYRPVYAADFRDLNYVWIRKYFEVEAADIEQLENPQVSILQPGGAILIALVAAKPVGACALEKLAPGRYELSKMAVDPGQQGKGIGLKLGQAIIERARQLGGKTLELESNTALAPAINLYRKLGFTEIPVGKTPYSRCNIRMRMALI
ncbi:MAG: MarR family transcriptional regulator/GNAT family N-acetyltransferase [Candidatus Marinimicrobia bacterium]|nr:MarR family transcriptional regulator/GNAT family N-acetyltransferase [Candidatus Neomarinimicrobiota bacterium]